MITNPAALGSILVVSFALLIDEILLASILQMLMGGGNTVGAISVALLGLCSAGIVTYLTPALQNPRRPETLRALLLFLFACSQIASIFAIMQVPLSHLDFAFAGGETTVRLLQLGVYALATLPFFMGGLAINVILRAHAREVSRLYFADLGGAAAGCLVSPLLLMWIGAPLGILAAALPALLIGLAGIVSSRLVTKIAAAVVVVLVGVLAFSGDLLQFKKLNTMGEVDRPSYRSFRIDPDDIEVDKWALDAWTIIRSPDIPQQWEKFRGWGVSREFRGAIPDFRMINFNARFSTYVTAFDGDLAKLSEWLDADLISLHYQLGRHYSSVLNLGAGGGREVLNALNHGASKVTAVDLSDVVINEYMKGYLLEFSGNLYQHPSVSAFADEGRSFAQRTKDRYDLIDMSIVGGASFEKMDLTRIDDLFTLEALRTYFERLGPDGVFSYVMYTQRADLVDQAAAQEFLVQPPYIPVLKTLSGVRMVIEQGGGVRPFSEHVLIAGLSGRVDPSFDLVHIIASKRAFSAAERLRFLEVCRNLGFDAIHPADSGTRSGLYAEIIESADLAQLQASLPFSVLPPTDDLPFNFAFDWSHLRRAAERGRLLQLLAANPVVSVALPITLLALLLVVMPLAWIFVRGGDAVLALRGSSGLLIYFALIGFGFMTVEIAVLFKLQLYLGKPIYGLTVALFGFLLSSALGSSFTQRFEFPNLNAPVIGSVALLLVCGLAFYLFSASLFGSTVSLPLVARVGISLAAIFPLAFAMGMLFPLGIKRVNGMNPDLIPWAWAVNGCLSLLGIMASRTAALFIGFDQTVVIGLCAYLAIAPVLLLMGEPRSRAAGSPAQRAA